MASIKSRVAGLERASETTVRRQWTDAELAVRVANILNNPELVTAHAPLMGILKMAVVGVQQRRR